MANRVKLDYAAFQAYRRTPEVQSELKRLADGIAERANSMSSPNHAGSPEYAATDVRSEAKGSIVLVSTDNSAARVDNGLHNTLLKAVGGGG